MLPEPGTVKRLIRLHILYLILLREFSAYANYLDRCYMQVITTKDEFEVYRQRINNHYVHCLKLIFMAVLKLHCGQ